jgi:hypothetical protein
MKRNLLVLGVLVCILALGMVFVSCDNGNGVETDTWVDVTSLDQLDGTWKGSFQEGPKPASDFLGENSGMEELFEGLKIALDGEITVTINAGTSSGQQKTKMTFSGDNIAMKWMVLSPIFEFMDDADVDDKNYSITMEEPIPEEPITESDLAYIQINSSGNKIKLFPEFFEEDGESFIEKPVELTKQS